MASRTHEVVATVGEYAASNGEKKKRYINIGSAFTDDQGRISIKLDAIPVSRDWSNWLSLYPVKEREEQRTQRPARQQPPARQNAQSEPDDDIPF